MIEDAPVVAERFRDEHWPEVEALYLACFGHQTRDAGALARCQREMTGAGWVVRADARVVGFGSVAKPDTRYDFADWQVVEAVVLALHPEARAWVASSGIRAHTTATDWLRYLPGARVGTAVGVDPSWRRRGVARLLAEARIEDARRGGARAFIVSCIQGSGSEVLYRELGFDMLVTVPDHYLGGEDMGVLGLRLGEPCDRDRYVWLQPTPRMVRAWRLRMVVQGGGLAATCGAVGAAWPAAFWWMALLVAWGVGFTWSTGSFRKPGPRELVIPGS